MPQYIQNSPQSKIRIRASNLDSGGADHLGIAGSVKIGFALDASGSMATIASEAISGFNALVFEQQKPGIPPAEFSLVLFNDAVSTRWNALPIAEVPLLNASLYDPSGPTALNDAIGYLILDISKRTTRSTKVLLAILTDGSENASQQFSVDDIARMVSYRCLNYDWQFIFIGPKEAAGYAHQIGIPESNIVDFDAEHIGLILNRLSKAIRAYQLGDRHYMLSLENGSPNN